MPRWRFWTRDAPGEPSTQGSRFSIPPRSDGPSSMDDDPDKAARLARLLRNREAVLFDVDQAEAASFPDNPWRERVASIDSALDAARIDRSRLDDWDFVPGSLLPSIPVTEVAVSLVPPPAVSFRIAQQEFHFAEEVDWAERGTQIARSELLLLSGDVETLVPAEFPDDERRGAIEHLEQSLFVFASDQRDRALAGEPLAEAVALSDLAPPDVTNGGWLDWKGHSAAAQSRAAKQRVVDQEIQRLEGDRAKELADLARWSERLPIARRRLAEVDTEIAALMNTA